MRLCVPAALAQRRLVGCGLAWRRSRGVLYVRTMSVEVYWQFLTDGHDGWDQVRCLYAYLAPTKPEILYIGRSWGVTVRQRWNRSGKEHFWDDLEKQRKIKKHRALLGEVALSDGQRLSHELLCDIESLLIQEVQPWGNIQSRHSRISRPGLVVACKGKWPARQKLYRDEE